MFQRLAAIKRRLYRHSVSSGLVKQKSFSINGKSIVLKNLSESKLLQEIALNGYESYEGEVVALIKHYPWKIGAFFDVGANIGFYSILAELFHPGIKVVAIEPFPRNIAYIENLKRENSLSFELIGKAIDKSPTDKKTLYFPTAKNSSRLASSASLINSFKGTSGIFNHLPYETVEVLTTTLSSIVAPHKEPCLVKLDCEGNELSILGSSQSVLERKDVDFIIEIMINDADKHEVFRLMKDLGYHGFLITNAGLVHEDRPLTFPYPDKKNRTIWKNHFFTRRSVSEIRSFSEACYGYSI